MGVDQCWVTIALDDASAVKAIVLAKSLRRVVTTRRVAVIFSSNVSSKMRNALLVAFDQCIKMEGSQEMNETSRELYAKILCWNVPFIKKCIFLHPDTLVVRNSDELFEISGVSAARNALGNIDTSVCVLRPSLVMYEKLVELMKTSESQEDGNERYARWIQQHADFSLLPDKYNVSVGEKLVAGTEPSIAIVRFTKTHPLEMDSESNLEIGVLEKAVLQYFERVYKEDGNDGSVHQDTDFLSMLTTNQKALPSISQQHLDNDQEPIAIIGMSCRFPMADNVDEYWDLLINGKDCIRKLPADRWPSATSDDYREVQAGFLKCPVDEFDGKFFNISPMELTHMDPQQRLLLEVTWEALENAGINPQSLEGTKTGVFVGTWTQDYRDLIKDVNGEFGDFHRTYMGNSLGGSGGRLSFVLGLTGPNIATESGCSSGIVGVYLACESLRNRRSDIALAAGANLLLHPFQKRHMINVASSDGRCKTFDEKADGFGRAEGVATLVLKRYSEAVKAGDNVLALIRGCGISQEGLSRSFGTPTKEVQEIAMRSALADAGLTSSDISYVEAHGTGTVVGDPIEMAAITNVYCKDREGKPLVVASGKTNIGHCESCSGLAGIIKVVLAMHNEKIPPHINLTNLNPYIKIDNIPVKIPVVAENWETEPGKPRIAGVSSFGITGTDAHVIIQEPPKYKTPRLNLQVKDRSQHLITFSAKSDTGLNDVIDNFTNYLETHQKVNLADAAHTLNSGRAHFMYRVGVVGSDVADIMKKLPGAVKNCKLVPESQPQVCFLYTGQGSQYDGMSKTLYETNAVFRMNFDRCDKLLQDLLDISIKPIIWGIEDNGLLHRTLYSQTSIFCVEYCLTKLWESWGIRPDAVVGHSLGEFAAAVCAGILELEDAIKLVAERSRLIEGVKEGKMVVIKAEEKVVDELLKQFLTNNRHQWLDYAAINSPEQTVLAGPPMAVDAFAHYCTEKNLKTHILDATNAFHSRDMDDIIPEYRKVVETVTHSAPKCTYISGVTGKVLEDGDMNTDYWLRHTRDAVKFLNASQIAFDEGYRVFLEIGPQPVLCALTMRNISENKYNEPITLLPSIRRKEDNWATILTTLSKMYQLNLDIDWDGFDQYYNREKIALPTYPFHRKKHWYEMKESKKGFMFNGKALHPLLGCQIPNATTSSIFQSTLELEKLPYLKDHAIGARVVFPGAGYADMCLTAGNISTIGEIDVGQDLMNPISIEKLAIEAPLGMADNESCHMQTVVVKTESAENKVSIYTQQKTSRNGESSSDFGPSNVSVKWTRQATSTFVPLQTNVIHQYDHLDSLDSIKSRCSNAFEMNEFYDKLMATGLEFGDAFRSLGTLYRNDNDENEILTHITPPPTSVTSNSTATSKNYICHPIVIDAMIQTIMVGIGKAHAGLHVPVVIDKTIVFSKCDYPSETSELYIHSKWDVNTALDDRTAVLYNGDGKLIAIMSGVTMIQTSSEVILKTLDSQQLVLPDMYEEVWRPKQGPNKQRLNLDALFGTDENMYDDPEFKSKVSHLNELNDKEAKSVARRDTLIYHRIIDAFYQLGWKPVEVGEVFTVDTLVQQLGIIKSYNLLMHRYMKIFSDEGIAKVLDDNEGVQLIKKPPTHQEAKLVIEQVKREASEETIDFYTLDACGDNLKDILVGKVSPLSVLFPDNKDSEIDASAETYYNNCVMLPKFFVALREVVRTMLEKHSQLPEEERGVIRILEVGAGVGSTTKIILPVFEEFGTKFQFMYTDISPAFFTKAETIFQSCGKKMQYKVLNIEEDPLSQGFIPHHYDLVIASNVLHATRDLAESLRHMRMLMKPQSYMLLMETLNPTRDYDMIFALLDGYWRFIDHDIRPMYPTVGASVWEQLCKAEGFDMFRTTACFDGRMGVITARASDQYEGVSPKEKWWLVFSTMERYLSHMKTQVESVGRKVLLVSKSNKYSTFTKIHDTLSHCEIRSDIKDDMMQVFNTIKQRELGIEGILYMWGMDNDEPDHLKQTHGLLFLAQILLSDFKGLPRVIVPTEGIMHIEDESAKDITSATLWGMSKCFRTEHFSLHVKNIDLDPDEQDEVKYRELFAELWNDDSEFQIVYRSGVRNVARLITCKEVANPLVLPRSERYSMALPASRNIADLKFCPIGRSELKDNDIEVKIRAFGLNFRDIFVVLKPSKEFENFHSVGLEFSATIVAVGKNVEKWKVGDCVIGCNFTNGALPSHICVDEKDVFGMPNGLTFCEAATIPAAFSTAYYCLVLMAKLTKDETVLIHAGSGGVGLFAIQVAKAVGAKIIATAGSRRKRAFLRNLGVEHVFHSRNTHYGKQILEVTGGKGVQVVLNSLTSPGFKEASLGVCCQNARFVEMSKLQIWAPEEVKERRPDVAYWVVDLTTVDPVTWTKIWGAVASYTNAKQLRPIPYIQYDATCVREALMYMQKAKHIGKIIINMPQMVQKDSELVPTIEAFSDRAAYLLTGGLGGIGMEVAKWMCKNGAKHLIVTSRGEPDERATRIIKELNSRGNNVVPMCLDVGDYNQCVQLLKNIQDPQFGLPQLRGIMHAAGALADATFTNQTLDSFKAAFHGKVYGAWNLHNLTMEYPLEFFMLFSSMTSIFGPIGQSNYCAANMFLDVLAYYRHSIGLCGQSINWGQWGEVGLSKDIKIPALRPFSPAQALEAMGVIMRSQKSQACVLDVDFTVVRKLSANIGSYLEEMKIAKENQTVALDVKLNNFWPEFDAAEGDENKLEVVKTYITNILRQILKFDDDEVIDENQKFSEMGMDSLMMLEMKNFIQTMLGKNITMNVSELAELTTVCKLSTHLMGLIKIANQGTDGNNEAKESYNDYTSVQKQLIEQDLILPEHVKANGIPCKRSEIKTVLLTGSTGKLGPYMLEALARRPLKKIVCLIRSKDDASAHERLISALEEKSLVLDMSKIQCLAGDITLKNFGLTQEKYDAVASMLDGVVHCAVKGNLMEPYYQSEGTANSDIRSVNVIGTRNVLEFAGTVKTKPVLHASTLLACHKVAANDTLHEDWSDTQDVYEMPNVGYPVSKFICEALATQAGERGIPIHVHRFPGLLGDKNGCFSFPNNHAMLRLLGFCKLGVMPSNPIPLQLLDVDYAAEVSCQLFFNDTAPPHVYNITNPHMCVLQDFPSVAKEFGFEIEIVEHKEFFDKLNSNDEFASLFPYREVDFEGDRFIDFTTSTVALQSWINNPEEFFVSQKLLSIFQDYRQRTEHPVDILRRDMQYAKKQKIFDKFGLKPDSV